MSSYRLRTPFTRSVLETTPTTFLIYFFVLMSRIVSLQGEIEKVKCRYRTLQIPRRVERHSTVVVVLSIKSRKSSFSLGPRDPLEIYGPWVQRTPSDYQLPRAHQGGLMCKETFDRGERRRGQGVGRWGVTL